MVEEFQLKGPENIFSNIIEDVPILKKEVSINVQEAYRIPNRLNWKRKIFCHIAIITLNPKNKERILKSSKGKAKKI